MGKRTSNPRRSKSDNLGFEQLESRLAMAVLINEFLASNTAGIQDENGDRSDWIELRNTDPAAVNVSGWHLTDDAADLDKWTLPSVSIPGGGYLLVYASGKDRAVSGQQLHTNFSLAQDGEYLALVMPDGVTVADAYAPFPAQINDISYGRGTGGTATDTLIIEAAQLKYLVPTTNAVDVGVGATPWPSPSFNDAAWASGTSGVGYDVNGVGQNLAAYVNTNVSAQMNSATRGSAYIRIPFQVANPADFTSLKIRMRYDDGYAIYINGTEITAARKGGPPATLGFNSSASITRNDTAAIAYEDFDLTPYKNLLVAGNNLLAIHGLNRVNSISNYGDFLIAPLLQADRALPGITGFMSTPSPGAVNQVGTLGVVADTKFSVNRGIYTAPINVGISTTTADAQIRYTLDGSDPTATSGFIYNPATPITISETTTLRAAAFKTGWTSTNIDTQTYVFLNDVVQQNGAGLPSYANWGWAGADWDMDPDIVNSPTYSGSMVNALQSIPTVSLVAPWSNWFGGAGVGIYPTMSELERQTSMEFFTADGTESWQIDGGIEVQGGTSDDRWKTDKLSMRIKFKEPYGPEKLNADIFHSGILDTGAATEFNTLVLDAQINYTWPYGGTSNPIDQRQRAKYIQDQYVADLQNLMGGNAPHGRFVHLYINGMYWGMYDVHERPDEHFAESYMGGNDEDWDVLKHTETDVVSGDFTAIDNFAFMLNTIRQDMTVPANYAAAANLVDVDDLINYMVLNFYVGNDDWPHHNWYATYNRVDPAGKWRFHSWDAEHVLKSVSYNAIGSDSGSPEEVHLALINNPEYRLRFSDLVQKHFATEGGLLTPQVAAQMYQLRMQEIDQAIIAESARWGDSHTTSSESPGAGNAYTRQDWLNTQNDLLTNYFPFRTATVRNQFVARNWLVPLGAVAFSKYGGVVASGYQLTLSKPAGSPAAGVLYYTLDGSDPRDPVTNLPRASAIVYSGAITINAGTQVKARIFQDLAGSSVNEWSPIVESTFVLETPFPLRITELNYNPGVYPGITNKEDLEFIELMNTGNQTISLDGVQITEFSETPYTFPNGLTLGAGQRIVVARTPSAFNMAYGAGYNLSPLGYTQNLSNGGERIALKGPVGETLQDFNYSDGGPSDGEGRTLEIVNPLGDPTAPGNWRVSFYSGGSPGTEGLAPTRPGDADGDGDVDGADFLAWQRGLGTQALKGGPGNGDANGDRAVTGADLQLLRNNFGATAVVTASSTAEVTEAVMIEALPGASQTTAAPTFGSNQWVSTAEAAPARQEPPRRQRLQSLDGAFAAFRHAGDANDAETALGRFARPPLRALLGADSWEDAGDDAADPDAPLACDVAKAWAGLHG